MTEKPFIKYDNGTIENSHLCHMFYIASLGFNIVPGMFWANGVSIEYESTPDGILIKKNDGESMLLPFRVAMALVSQPIQKSTNTSGKKFMSDLITDLKQLVEKHGEKASPRRIAGEYTRAGIEGS